MRPTITENQWAHTEVKVNRPTFEWTIENWEFLPQKKGEPLESPCFFTGQAGETWKLQFYPQGNDKAEVGNTSLFLVLIKSERPWLCVNCIFSIFKGDNLMLKWTYSHAFDEPSERWGYRDLIARQKLEDSANTFGSTIRIHCAIGITSKIVSSVSSDDMIIIAEDEKIPAHKHLLAARSSLFSDWFKLKDGADKYENEVRIEGLKPKVVRGMLEFFEKKQVTDLGELADGLLEAAQRYDLEDLRDECEKSLIKLIDRDNAVDFLELADRYGIDELKENALQYIKEHSEEVITTDGYRQLKDLQLLNDSLLPATCCRQISASSTSALVIDTLRIEKSDPIAV